MVPADNKWFTRLVVSTVVVETLESLDLAYPKVEEAKRKELEAAKKDSDLEKMIAAPAR